MLYGMHTMAKGRADATREARAEGAEAQAPTGSLSRGLAVLHVLASAAQPMGLAELAMATGLEQSTTLRLLKALEDIEYVLRLPDSKRYLPSPKALMPLPLPHPLEQLRAESWPVLQELTSEISQTVVLLVYLGGTRMVLNLIRGREGVAPYYGSWMHGPLHATAIGKALLLTYDAPARRKLLGKEPFEQATPHTLTRWDELDAELRLSAERGYTIGSNEYHEGLTAAAANVATWDGSVTGCIAATGQTRAFEGARMQEIGLAVKRAAGYLLYRAPSMSAVARFCNA